MLSAVSTETPRDPWNDWGLQASRLPITGKVHHKKMLMFWNFITSFFPKSAKGVMTFAIEQRNVDSKDPKKTLRAIF